MADISFADVKVLNEVERISYYEKLDDVSFFKRVFAGGEKSKCTLCINEMQRDKAEEILEAHPDLKAGIEMINKKVERTFF